MTAKYKPCGCSALLIAHNHWCAETPIFAQMCKDWGGNPADAFPFIIFGLIA